MAYQTTYTKSSCEEEVSSRPVRSTFGKCPSGQSSRNYCPPTRSQIRRETKATIVEDNSSDSTRSSARAYPALMEECIDAWESQGNVKQSKATAVQCSSLTYQFCVALSLAEWSSARVVLMCVRMLVECGYDFEDIEVMFAMALGLLRSARSSKFTEKMGPQEKLLVAVLHLYMSHSMVFDQFVSFEIWHEWMLAPFCSVRNSSNALKQVCSLRQWHMNVPPAELEEALLELREVKSTC